MKLRSHIKQAFRKLSEIKKVLLHVLLLSLFFTPILLVFFIDFFNIEAFVPFNEKFMFEFTWKGRMFYLFFMWLLLLESILDWEVIVEKQRTSKKRLRTSHTLRAFRTLRNKLYASCTLRKLLNLFRVSCAFRSFLNRFRLLLLCIFAAVPSVYILSVNFFGLNQVILNVGQSLQISSFNYDWPLSLEYLILVSFFIFATWLAYGLAGLKSFSISLSLLAGIYVVYLVDTIWPFGTFKPMQLLTVPTAAFSTALLDLLGYNVGLSYSSLALSPEYGSMPLMKVWKGEELPIGRYIGWPCAGVHSLLLFTLITLVFFKKTKIQRERKIIFFLIGAAGTYLTNIFRIASFFTIAIHYGETAGNVFHDSYGELYFIAWMLLYFIIMIAIQSGKINRFTQAFRERLTAFRIYGRR